MHVGEGFKMIITGEIVKLCAYMINEYCNQHECEQCQFDNYGCLFTATSPNYWSEKIEKTEN